MKFKLSEIAYYVSDKVGVSEITIENYVSTENLLPNRGGKGIATRLPDTGKVTKFKPKDILISNIRPYFKKIWFATENGGNSADVLNFRANEQIVLPEYLFWLLFQDEFFNRVMGSVKGTKMPRGDKKAIMEFEFEIPSFEIQRSIAKTLFLFNHKIQLNRRINDNLLELSSTLVGQFKLEHLSELQAYTIDELAALNSVSAKKAELLATIQYLDTSNITENSIDEIQVLNPMLEKIPSRARRHIKNLDIVYSTVRPNQKHYGIMLNPDDNLLVSTGFTTITANTDKISPFHLFVLLTDNQIVKGLQAIAEGSTSTYPAVRPQDIGGIELELPNFRANVEFGKLLEPMFMQINANNQMNQNLSVLRDSLLPKLLAGKIDLD
ncbi:restriction endonuclease subunit S [Periweissella cryptocerci]|uniref:Restriction endonuclease subunit S n=1 Tax=Periweissella cryptocerci TaxID=2506420 RepID=A0A4P6YT03_9LACO|nr:restriction endonuclease subunit S [Periweissella cryptocerci]QBO35782.1 restriction endonuclease subunit S [Periweissella cryptocerci]